MCDWCKVMSCTDLTSVIGGGGVVKQVHNLSKNFGFVSKPHCVEVPLRRGSPSLVSCLVHAYFFLKSSLAMFIFCIIKFRVFKEILVFFMFLNLI